jgi:hypothetical protein
MKHAAILFALALPLAAALAQPSAPEKLFQSGADIPALIAKAKAAQKSPTINSVLPIVTVMPYRVLLEYRTGLTPPTLHHGEAELVHVLKGAANLATGGHLTGIQPPRPGNATDVGTGIEGATKRHIVEGDYVMVPPSTAHQFQDVEGEFVIMSVHLPVPGK